MPRSDRPLKAYKDLEFLASKDARVLRILSEYLEPLSRFRRHRVEDTVVFFGSARIVEPAASAEALRQARAALKAAPRPSKALRAALQEAETRAQMSRYYTEAAELARRITEWSKSLRGKRRRFLVCSGGGPGIMEAANRGAAEARGRTVGLGISLPFEQTGNRFISRELSFEFHYFFMRKFWFFYLAKAMVMFPGGFGTLDEAMEVLTLIQTEKSSKRLPIVFYGTSYWREVLDLDAMVRWGTIGKSDLDLVRFCDSTDEAFTYLRDALTETYLTP